MMALCFLFGGCSSADGGVSDLEFVDPPIDPPIGELISDTEVSNPPVPDTSTLADVVGSEDSVGPPISDVVTPPDAADTVPSDDVVPSDITSPLDDVTADTSDSDIDVSEDASPMWRIPPQTPPWRTGPTLLMRTRSKSRLAARMTSARLRSNRAVCRPVRAGPALNWMHP
jgi:hypothetical protein